MNFVSNRRPLALWLNIFVAYNEQDGMKVAPGKAKITIAAKDGGAKVVLPVQVVKKIVSYENFSPGRFRKGKNTNQKR